MHIALIAVATSLFLVQPERGQDPAQSERPGRTGAEAPTQPEGALAVDPEEWKPLFDGRTLEGFVVRGGAATFRVEDGSIVGTTAPDTPNTFLCTEREYGDFVLEFEVLVHPELNSGVQIRSQSRPDHQDGRVHGYQVEIDPTPRGYSGGIYDEGRRGWLAKPTEEQAAASPFRPGEWNHYRVEASGNRIRTWINSVPMADLIDDVDASGFIGLQVHGVGGRTDPLEVRWRELRIAELD